jgi:hypothetical protein
VVMTGARAPPTGPRRAERRRRRRSGDFDLWDLKGVLEAASNWQTAGPQCMLRQAVGRYVGRTAAASATQVR